MKSRIVLSFALIALSAMSVNAQNSGKGALPSDSPAQTPKKAKPEKEKKPKTNLRTSYDKFTGLTTWETKMMTAWQPSFAFQFVVDPFVRLTMQAFARKSDGNTTLTCGLFFYSQAKSWWYLDNSTLTILANGERHSFDGQHTGDVMIGMVTERIYVLTPCDTLSVILKSDALEMRLGGTEFKVTDKNLKELRMILPVLNN